MRLDLLTPQFWMRDLMDEIIQHHGVKGMHWGVITKKKSHSKQRRHQISEAANAYRSGDTKKYKKLSKGISQQEIDAKLIHDRKRARTYRTILNTGSYAFIGSVVPFTLSITNPAVMAVSAMAAGGLMGIKTWKSYDDTPIKDFKANGKLSKENREKFRSSHSGANTGAIMNYTAMQRQQEELRRLNSSQFTQQQYQSMDYANYASTMANNYTMGMF